ncbi:MAG: TetR/AcrR family transcriptional regulator [bacterium]|nr:TetR/AcrR family transcriptional regulator [bacterium]
MSKKAQQSDRTRRSLVRVARRLFGERGYEATFIDEVARKSRMTKGALYHQFRDKRDLFAAVLDEEVVALVEDTRERASTALRDSQSPRSSIRLALAGMQILLDHLSEPIVRQIVLLDGPVVLGHQRWQEILYPLHRGLVRSILRSAGKRGEIAPELADPLSSLLFGVLQEMALTIGHAEDPEAKRTELAGAARWILERVLRDEAPPA